MFYVTAPITNIQLFKEFLSNQLRDGLADVIQDGMSVRELELYQSLAIQTTIAVRNLESAVKNLESEIAKPEEASPDVGS